MFSIKEIIEDLNLSWFQVLSPEIILISAIEGAFKVRKRPLSFSEICQLLEGILSKDVIHKSLDRALDAGLLNSTDGCDELDMNSSGKYYYRGYKPALGEFITARDFLMKIANLIEKDNYSRIENGNRQFDFEIASIHDARNFIETLHLLNHILTMTAKMLKRKELPHTLVYKLIGCIWEYSENWQKTSTIKITPAQYGRIPSLNSHIGQFERKYIGYVMCSLKEWEDTEKGYKYIGNESQLDESIEKIDKSIVQDVERLTAVFVRLAERTDRSLILEPEKIAKNLIPNLPLNILVTCPDQKLMVQSCSFEYESMFEWLDIFLKIHEFWSWKKDNTHPKELIPQLEKFYIKSRELPLYQPISEGNWIEDVTTLDKNDALLNLQNKINQVRKIANPSFKTVEELMFNLQKAILSQIWRARLQISRKFYYYYEEVKKIQKGLYDLTQEEDYATERRIINKILDRVKPPKEKPDIVSFLENASKGLVALICDHFPDYIPDEISDSWIGSKEQKKNIETLEKLKSKSKKAPENLIGTDKEILDIYSIIDEFKKTSRELLSSLAVL